MLQTTIFKKAKSTYHSGQVTKIGDGRKGTYYEVYDEESNKTHQVSIKQEGSGITIDCPCTQQSLHQQKRVLCSHIISTINYLYFHTTIKK